MTKIKLCGMMQPCDIYHANELMPDFIGFVFAAGSKRCVTWEQARLMRSRLNDGITPVGVFVNETIENIEYLVDEDIIQIVQLHGSEDNDYVKRLRSKVTCPIIQAFRIETKQDIAIAAESEADYIMLDSGGGTGECFNHSLIGGIRRDFFLAGGLCSENVGSAISLCKPYAVDASSSLETKGIKDKNKMTAFVKAVRCGKGDVK